MSANALSMNMKAVRCPRCERQLTVAYRPSEPPAKIASTIVCPFCDQASSIELDGKVASVVAHDLRKPQ